MWNLLALFHKYPFSHILLGNFLCAHPSKDGDAAAVDDDGEDGDDGNDTTTDEWSGTSVPLEYNHMLTCFESVISNVSIIPVLIRCSCLHFVGWKLSLREVSDLSKAPKIIG